MRVRSVVLHSSIVLSLFAVACSGDDSTDTGPGGSTSDASSPDGTASGGRDAGHDANDAATLFDATTTDASSEDATTSDGSTTDAPITSDAGEDANDGSLHDGNAPGDAGGATQVLTTTIDLGVTAVMARINLGTAIGQGAGNGSTPSTLTDLRADPSNTDQTNAFDGGFASSGTVPDTAAGFCVYPADGGAPTRVTHVTGATFESAGDGGMGTDPLVPMAPFYFPLVYTTTLTPAGNTFGGQPPIIGLFDWRPKDIDEALVVAESDDLGRNWYFMQTVLELYPDETSPISGGYDAGSTSTGCPATITSTNAKATSANGSTADDGWGHAAILQLPGVAAGTGQFLYLLDRNGNDDPSTNKPIVDNAPLRVIQLVNASNKFPIWNTNKTNDDIKSIGSALASSPDAGAPLVVRSTTGLANPDGILAVFPTAPSAPAGSPVTVMWVQKIVGGDNTGATALPTSQQCTAAPFSKKTNHDIATVHLATTTNGVDFQDLGAVEGLSDPTTVDYGGTRWVSPRGTLLDVNGDGSVWGLYFAGGNCLDGDSDAFHFIGYAESTDKVHWTVFNDVNHPIASINAITTTNQAGGATVTIPAHAPIVPTEPWFAERLYAPTAVRIDATHLSMTFAGYGVQTPSADLLNYRQIGNVVLTVSKPLPAGVPNNVNSH